MRPVGRVTARSMPWRWWSFSLCLVLVGTLGAAREGEAQVRTLHTVRADSLFGAPGSIRLLAHRLLLAEGFSVRDVAACDCLVVTDPSVRANGETVELRVHILKPPSAITLSVVVEAMVGGAAGGAIRRGGAPSAEVAGLLDRLRTGMSRSKEALRGATR